MYIEGVQSERGQQKIMLAVVYDDSAKSLQLINSYPKPLPGPADALIKVHRTGVCSTDIEITRGYVPGYKQPLGHEFVGTVVACDVEPQLVGNRVVGEINCNDAGVSCADAVFQRNHAAGRSVLGIINHPGSMAEYITLPATNLHLVPADLPDAMAAFAEPLAAACRILEQGILEQHEHSQQLVAVLGDGRLGLLIAQVLAVKASGRVTLIGRHRDKMSLVKGTAHQVLSSDAMTDEYQGTFDVVIDATGSASSIRTALALTKPLGKLVLKTTVSLSDPNQPGWSELANDVVVNEKVLVGSRCGPMDQALQMMSNHVEIRQLLTAMLQHEVPLRDGVEAMRLAQSKEVIKVHIVM